MEWYVYYYNINKNKIEKFNIFNHYTFCHYVKKYLKIYDKESFTKQLESELFYYFWSKYEYELIIKITKDNHIFLSPWLGCKNADEVKIDVTDNTDFNWRDFAEEHIKQQRYNNEAKIDVYDQVIFNWDLFVEFVWNNKKELLKEKD